MLDFRPLQAAPDAVPRSQVLNRAAEVEGSNGEGGRSTLLTRLAPAFAGFAQHTRSIPSEAGFFLSKRREETRKRYSGSDACVATNDR